MTEITVPSDLERSILNAWDDWKSSPAFQRVQHAHPKALRDQSLWTAFAAGFVAADDETVARIDEAVAKERERCARVVEDHAEGSRGGERILVPRHYGNLSGLGYAHAIRTPTPTTEEGA